MKAQLATNASGLQTAFFLSTIFQVHRFQKDYFLQNTLESLEARDAIFERGLKMRIVEV